MIQSSYMNMEDRIVTKLFEHDQKFEMITDHMFTKADGLKMTDVLEGIATICKNIRVA